MKKIIKNIPIRKKSKTQPAGRQVGIYIVDDHPIVRRGLAQLIGLTPDLVVCGEAGTAQEALADTKLKTADLALVDISLKDDNGLELIKDIRKRYPKVIILVLSMHDETYYAERSLHAGAKGYVMKQQATEQFLAAIRRVLAGEVYLSDTMSSRILRRVTGEKNLQVKAPTDFLSDRELEVFGLIGKGLGTRQIAEKLSRSVKTVETYREHIKLKLGLKDSSELLQHAIQWSQSRPVAA
ncbi:MAG: response regulator transcription factor [Candidatus Omnitrophica bacterium]|nr:response regulator transcription factor [Candidatus Omnitrophota bacterium]